MKKFKFQKDDDKRANGISGWITTYADMVTLLLTFFVFLYSVSTVNPVKSEQFVQLHSENETSVLLPDNTAKIQTEEENHGEQNEYDENDEQEETAEFSEMSEIPLISADELDYPQNFDNIYGVMQQYVADDGYSDMIDIEKDENYVMLRFKDKIFFESGKADVNKEGQDIIKFVAEAINAVIDQIDEIKIAGHTDNYPQNSNVFPSNWELSAYRAINVLHYLSMAGIPQSKMVSMGYGGERPIASNETPEGKSENRRVEIYITRAEPESDRE